MNKLTHITIRKSFVIFIDLLTETIFTGINMTRLRNIKLHHILSFNQAREQSFNALKIQKQKAEPYVEKT